MIRLLALTAVFYAAMLLAAATGGKPVFVVASIAAFIAWFVEGRKRNVPQPG